MKKFLTTFVATCALAALAYAETVRVEVPPQGFAADGWSLGTGRGGGDPKSPQTEKMEPTGYLLLVKAARPCA